MTLEPSEPAVQAFNIAIAKELATKYDIAGMQVDYIKVYMPVEGYETPAAE